MNNFSFLENLYFKKIDKKFISEVEPVICSKQVLDFLENFKKITGKYNPIELEKLKKIPVELLDDLKKSKIFGLNIPKQYGGLDFDLIEYLKVIENISKSDLALVLIPLAHLSIGLKGIVLFGNDFQKEKYLTKAATGETIFAYALTEPLYGSDAQHITTTAILSEDQKYYILNGNKTYITNGNYAKAMTVFAQLDENRSGNMGAFIVETGYEGVKVGADMPKMGLAISSTTMVSFKDVKVPVENLLGNPGDGFKIAMQILNFGRLGLGAASTGLIDQSVELMIKRSNKRKQFSQPIKNFQLIQEKIIKNKINHAIINSITYFTAGLLQNDPLTVAAMESSHCKLFGTNNAWQALYDAQQTYGGAGYLKTQPIEKKLRDSRVTTIFEGTTEIHSIYPALFLFNHINKELQQNKYGKFATFVYLLKLYFKSSAIPIKNKTVEMKNAKKLSIDVTSQVRKLLVKGLLKYGKKVVNKQFYLRKITELSVLNYSIIAFISYIDNKSQNKELLLLLSYIVKDFKLKLTAIKSSYSKKYEKLHTDIFNFIDKQK